jgi:hypothetical protein
MKNKFVADGQFRFLRGRKAATSESIEKKYAAELATAGPDEKRKIRERMVEEFLRREKTLNHKPSAGTLW